MATSKTTITSSVACRSLPPVGAFLLCQETPSAAAYPVTVEKHLGRYFYAAGHRFHVFDDWLAGGLNPTWRTDAALVTLLSDEEAARIQEATTPLHLTVTFEVGMDLATVSCHGALMEPPTALPGPAPPGRGVWRPPAPPAGPDEPTETW
jgi:hypothetical protein